MSLYNQIFGFNPFAPVLLQMIRLDSNQVARFRDCYLDMSGEKIIIYTRTGGGNRETYQRDNEVLAAHRLFIRDYDDDFDSTYAYFEFKIPDNGRELAKALFEAGHGKEPAGDRFKKLLAKMQGEDAGDPDVRRALEVGKKIIAEIGKVSDKDNVQVIEV